MRRQFVRLYVALFLVLATTALLFFFFVLQEFQAASGRQIQQFMTPLVGIIREKIGEVLDDPEDLRLVLDSINTLSPVGVHITTHYEQFLPQTSIERIDRGDIVAVRSPSALSVYARAPGGGVIHIGPISAHAGGKQLYLVMVPPLLMLALIGTLIYLLIRPIERRILSLADTAGRFGNGELTTRAQMGAGGTFDELAGAFNQMADRIESLIGGQKELLRAVSHELRTPLARVFFALDHAQASTTVEEKNSHLKRIDRSLVELNDLVEELMTYLRLEKRDARTQIKRMDIAQVLQEMRELAADLNPDVTVVVDCPDLEVFADSHNLRRALSNLVGNAIRHAKSRILIECQNKDGGFAIGVEDDGPGIPESEREKIFEPFYRLDSSRGRQGGAGLGLAIVSRIMQRHNGTVTLVEGTQKGARFVLQFPEKGNRPA